MDAWRWGRRVKEIVKYTSAVPRFKVLLEKESELFGKWRHNFAYRGRMINCS